MKGKKRFTPNPGVLVICIASSCTTKNAQEKKPKKNVHQASAPGALLFFCFFLFKKTDIKLRGGHHMQRNVSLPPRCAHANCRRDNSAAAPSPRSAVSVSV
jgi:hypothetical protein